MAGCSHSWTLYSSCSTTPDPNPNPSVLIKPIFFCPILCQRERERVEQSQPKPCTPLREFTVPPPHWNLLEGLSSIVQWVGRVESENRYLC